VNRIGWEPIWASEHIPDRYTSFAAPNSTVVEWADSLPPGAAVFDLGCGVGRHVTYLGGRGFRMAGSDISPTGVQRTRAACAGRGLAFDGRICDMTTLPWPDETLDAALCTSTIHHALRANIQQAIAEVWRILKLGSLFLVDFPCTDTWDYQHLRTGVMAGHTLEVEPDTFVDQRADSEDLDGYLPHHYCDESDVRDLLRRFTIERLWPALQPAPPELGQGQVGKWVAWARKTAQAPHAG
jgi:SAM-dependent methyltransferase